MRVLAELKKIEKTVSKESVGTLADCEWRAAAPGLKPLRLPRARRSTAQTNVDMYVIARMCHVEYLKSDTLLVSLLHHAKLGTHDSCET